MRYLVAKMLAATFENEFGKFQVKKESPMAMLTRFSLGIDHEKEEGYRNLEIAIFAPMNYVGVWVRETWNVIPTEDLEYDEASDESFVKAGKDYVQGASEWKRVAYHDSCWRDGLNRTLEEYQKRIGLGSFSGLLKKGFYEPMPASALPENG